MFEVTLLLALLSVQQKPAIRAEKNYEPYKLVRLSAENVPAKAGVVWRVRPSKAIDKASCSDKTKLEFVAPPGQYDVEILVVTVAADGQVEISEQITTITIGEAKPPEPPTPPTPPTPADPLADAIKGIFGGLQDPEKATKAQALAKAHRRGVELLADPSIQTAGQLYQGMRSSLQPLDLKPVRERIAEEYDKALPTDPAVILSAEQRASASKLFTRVATILENLK